MGIIRRVIYNAIDNEMNPNLNNPNANVVYAAPVPYGAGYGRGYGRGYLGGGPYYDRFDRRMARRDMRRGYVDPVVAVGTIPSPMQQQQMMMQQQQQQQFYNNNNNMQYQQGPPPQQYNNSNNMQYAPPQGPPMYTRDMSPQNGNGNGNSGSSSRDMPRSGNSPQPRGFFDEESDVHAPPPYVDNRHNQKSRDEKN
ncbi:hypothetical protein Sste5346_001130 [Sporothrix stenoceras]|uniref:Uncharacterized protein n=1 Tax=Sporothrix stenoceras TaxID=5173 RepID=A0ABR3ZRB8_9PEZI